jgi:hypothetical protein
MTKYIGERLAKNFNKSQANSFFKNLKRIISPTILSMVKVVVLCDDGNLSILKSDYFICI